MWKALNAIIGLTLCCLIALTSAGQITVPAGFQLRRIAGNLNPTDLAVAPDGRLFLCEKQGVVRVIKDDVLLSTPAFTISNLNNNNERGLLGIVFDPDFDSNGFVYVHYTYTNGSNYSQVSRFTLSGDTAVANSEQKLITLDKHDTNGGVHNGGAIRIANNKLFMFVGNLGGSHSQNMASPYGKSLRFNLDGSIPTDNPFYDSASGNARAIWASGLRNPFMAAWNSENNDIMIGDVGEGSWEEINLNTRSANFGWSNAEGFSSNSAYTNPVVAYGHAGACSIAGLAYYQDIGGDYAFPTNYNGHLFFSDYCGGWIRSFKPSAPRTSNTVVNDYAPIVVQGLAGSLTMAQSTDGGLYFVDRGTHNGASEVNTGVTSGILYKLVFTGSDAPFIHTQPTLPVLASGASGAKLYVGVTGAAVLKYQWYKDGQPINGATSDTHYLPTVTLEDDGTEFYVNVSNSEGSDRSDTFVLVVSEGQPVLSIDSPATTLKYKAGDTIQYSGTAEDPSKTSLTTSWTIVFHHQDHVHPFLGPIYNVTNGEFTVPTDAELDPVQWYRIYFEAINAKGLSTSIYLDIQPDLGSFLIDTDPEGLSVLVDGIEVATPNILTGVKGMRRLLSAPLNQTINGRSYYFMGWSDREGPEHYVTFSGNQIPMVAAYGTNSPTSSSNIMQLSSLICFIGWILLAM